MISHFFLCYPRFNRCFGGKNKVMTYPTLLHEWFEEIWNKGNIDAIDRLMTAETVIHHLDADGASARGPEEFRAFFKRFQGAFPDTKITVHNVFASGDMLAARWTVSAHHAGDHLGFPATHKAIEVEGMCIGHVRDGKLAEAWNLWDAYALMRQLGFKFAHAAAS